MITPDDVRRRGRTLEQSVLHDGWPALRDSRGKVMFLLDNDPGAIRDAYIAGRPNLEGRVLFTNSRPGFDDAAFIKRNEPRAINTATSSPSCPRADQHGATPSTHRPPVATIGSREDRADACA